MGLLDALFQNDTGGGLLSGLPQSWQWQNPTDKNTDQDFLAALRQDPSMGNNLVAPQSPFGAVPSLAPQPPQSIFASGTGSIAPSPGMMPSQAPQMAPQPPMQPAPPQMAAPAPTPPAPQNNPINSMNIGGYQMPQFGSAQDYTPQAPVQTAQAPSTDISAQSRQPQEQPLPPAFGGGSILGRIGSPDGLIAKLTGNDTRSLAQQNLKAQYDAVQQTLRDSGMSPREAQSKAMLAVMNPEAGKTILNEALTSKEQFKTVTDAMGNQVPIFVNERDQTINGKKIGEADVGGSAGFLAPGVKSIDSTLKGADYLGQFSPEVKAAVQDYVDGKSMPTGNPRKGFTQTVKMIAQKYGADTNQTVDDSTYSARRTMRNQLSSSAPSSLGGQINIGNTAAGHLADLTQKAIELGNVDTGIAPLTSAVNSVRGLGTEQAAKMEALKGAAQHYGQEITKFYAGSPGGVAERDRFIESVNGARSPKELAAILSTEAELMRSRLDALGGQIKGVLGDEGSKQYPVLRPDGEAALAKVEQNVSRLKGNAPAAASGGIPSGWSVKVH